MMPLVVPGPSVGIGPQSWRRLSTEDQLHTVRLKKSLSSSRVKSRQLSTRVTGIRPLSSSYDLKRAWSDFPAFQSGICEVVAGGWCL